MPQEGLTELWISRINDYRVSGERVASWCERHQVTSHQLFYWMKKLGKAEQKTLSPSKPKWVSLRVDESVSDAASPILVRVGAATIEVRSHFDPSLFADVVRTLKTLC